MNFYLKNLSDFYNNSFLTISGESFHHFKNVYRGKPGTSGKIFNGSGLVAFGEVREIHKKELIFHVEKYKKYESSNSLKLILGVPKKEYFESIIRSCTQIGINEIMLVQTKFSPWNFKAYPRINKIIESSIIQSENPFSPSIVTLSNLEMIKDVADKVVFFSTESSESENSVCRPEGSAFIIGPEGGFHPSEVELICSLKNTKRICLPNPIMKSEVAVVYAAGLLA